MKDKRGTLVVQLIKRVAMMMGEAHMCKSRSKRKRTEEITERI